MYYQSQNRYSLKGSKQTHFFTGLWGVRAGFVWSAQVNILIYICRFFSPFFGGCVKTKIK